MIVDSGVWIDHFAGRRGGAVAVLQAALSEGSAVLVLPIILQEILQGTKDNRQFRRYEQLLQAVPLARVSGLRRIAQAAARYYAELRWQGLTVPPTDCFIAASALASRWPLLTGDADFRQIARIEPRLQLMMPAGR